MNRLASPSTLAVSHTTQWVSPILMTRVASGAVRCNWKSVPDLRRLSKMTTTTVEIVNASSCGSNSCNCGA
ncbi:hypothetical protein FRC08_008768, partial [Ceratobasidium sp. 394]